MCACCLVLFFATPWTVAHQAPLSMGFFRQECWSGLPFPPPGDLPDPGIEPMSLSSPTLADDYLPLAPPGKPFTQDRSIEFRAGGNWGIVVCPVLTERRPRHGGILVACPASSGLQAAVLLRAVAVCLHPSATEGPASWAARGGRDPACGVVPAMIPAVPGSARLCLASCSHDSWWCQS